jgi:hypothetical protein
MLSLATGMVSALFSIKSGVFGLDSDLTDFYSSLLTIGSSISEAGIFFLMILKMAKAIRLTAMTISKIQNYCLSFQRLGT